MDWVQLVAAAVGGGFAAKLLEMGVAEFRRHSDRSRATQDLIDRNLDPILKSADELYAKLASLAREDFTEFRAVTVDGLDSLTADDRINLCNVLYLFAHFWSRLEIFRKESIFVELQSDKRALRLHDFLSCLESQKVRVIDRARQRAVGESLLIERIGKPDCVTFRGFLDAWRKDDELRFCLTELAFALLPQKDKAARQRVLEYGVIVHALLDTLDPKHVTTRRRTSYPNKLSVRTRRDLERRVFSVYLKFVPDPSKYTKIEDRRLTDARDMVAGI